MKELIDLRVSVARIAQAADLADMIPGAKDVEALPYERLRALAESEARGWNFLCALIVTAIEQREGRQRV